MNPLYETMATSVFERMSLAAAKHQAINLGQGFPDFGWPEPILDAAAAALREGSNQYAPSRGLPVLREAVADHYRRHHGIDLDAEGVCVTSGATEALAAAILATVEPGDEVIVMTPAYDAYAPLIERAGGVVREVALAPPEWRIEQAALEAAVTQRTRAIIFNNPHNPTGRLFDAGELEAVARGGARRMTWSSSATRCGSICCSTGRRFVPLGVARRHGGADAQMRVGGKDLLADRVEDRLGRGGARACHAGGARAPVPDLCLGAQFAGRGRFRAGRGRRVDCADARAVRAGARPDARAGSRRRALRCCRARRPIS